MAQSLAFTEHNHDRCIASAVERADRYCRDAGLRLTPVRRRVLELLLEAHKAMTAYAILDRLREEGLGSQPPVAYRALQFLTGIGFAHRVERMNAFVACAQPEHGHAPALLICRTCQGVAEICLNVSLDQRLNEAAEDTGFVIEQTNIEAIGLCPACRDGAPA